MKPKRYTTEAIVLARRNYSEADRILVVFTKDYGKIPLIAKAIRRPNSKKRGSLEVFSRINFSAAIGKNLDIVTEVENIDLYPAIRKSLKKTSLAFFFMEAVGRTSHEGEKNIEVYNLLVENLKKLKKTRNLKELRLNFIITLLTILGFWPQGKDMDNPDYVLEEVVEREMNSIRVGKKLLY